jgi:hypothetical protein
LQFEGVSAPARRLRVAAQGRLQVQQLGKVEISVEWRENKKKLKFH